MSNGISGCLYQAVCYSLYTNLTCLLYTNEQKHVYEKDIRKSKIYKCLKKTTSNSDMIATTIIQIIKWLFLYINIKLKLKTI